MKIQTYFRKMVKTGMDSLLPEQHQLNLLKGKRISDTKNKKMESLTTSLFGVRDKSTHVLEIYDTKTKKPRAFLYSCPFRHE